MTPGGGRGGLDTLVRLLCLVLGSRGPHYWRHAVAPLIHRSPPPPGSAPREGQLEAAADTRHFQCPTPNDATVWSPRGDVVLMTLGAKLGALHTRVSVCWAELF